MDKMIKPEELQDLLANDHDIVLLDVRRRSDLESDRSSIPGAEWRDPDKVEEWSQVLPAQKQVIIYCVRGGSVSNKVLGQLGVRNISARYLEGGITAWKAAGGKTQR